MHPIIVSMGCHHSCQYHAKRIACDIVWLLRYLKVKKKRVHDTSPELRSLRELKKGLTDGLKGGFWGIVCLRIGFYGKYATREFNFLCLLFNAPCLRFVAILPP